MSKASRVLEAIELSPLQKEYQEFFRSVLKKFGVKSPAELDVEKKKEFFNYIEKTWTKDTD